MKVLIIDDESNTYEVPVVKLTPAAPPAPCPGGLFLINLLISTMKKANFSIAEVGGSGTVQLQVSTDGGTTWTNLGSPLTLTNGQRTVTDNDDIAVDDTIYLPGTAYLYRLVDTAGSPVSNVVSYAIPLPESMTLNAVLSDDKTQIAMNLTIVSGSGNYQIQAKGANLGDGFISIGNVSGPTSGTANIQNVAVSAPNFLPGNTYTFRIADVDSELVSTESTVEVPANETITLTSITDNGDGSQIIIHFNVSGNGSGHYKLQAKGANLDHYSWDDFYEISGVGSEGDFAFTAYVDDDGRLHQNTGYTFQVIDVDTGVNSNAVDHDTPTNTLTYPITLDGVSADGSSNVSIAYHFTLGGGDTYALYLRDITANTSALFDGSVNAAGSYLQRSSTSGSSLPYVNRHIYQLAVVDLTVNPSADLTHPSTLWSNPMTAYDLTIFATEAEGGLFNTSYDGNITDQGFVSSYGIFSDGSLESGVPGTGARTPRTFTHGSNNITISHAAESSVPVQLRFRDPSGHLVGATVFTLSPALSITGYAAVHTEIGFANPSGGDNWTATFLAAPTALQSPAGATITGFDCSVNFASGGTSTTVGGKSGNTTDTTVALSHGAGVYALSQTFHFSDGKQAAVSRLIKVDGAGNILADIQNNGLTINSVSGLNVDVTSSLVQTGVSETPNIAAFNSSYTPTALATTTAYAGAIPSDSIGITAYTTLDPTFWSDIPSSYLSAPFQLGYFCFISIS